jgi:WD40 repeat protein
MVQQIKPKVTPAWKALLALSVAVGALLWHLLACTESPMAFSPDGENLAFVTMEPYDPDDMVIADTNVYRLMVLTKAKDLKVIEETSKFMLSAPAYSPDGKQLCYLRVPLLSQEQAELLKKTEPIKPKEIKIEFDSTQDPESSTSVAMAEPKITDLSMPPAEQIFESMEYFLSAAHIPATLVIRDAQSYAILSRTKIEIPLSKEGVELYCAYLLTRPQYSPDSQWIYMTVSHFVVGVNPKANEMRILAGPVSFGEKFPFSLAAVSPDGKTIATIAGAEKPVLGLIQTDGQKSTYHRLPEPPSPSGVVWKDTQTLVLLNSEENTNNPKINLRFLNSDGSVQNSISVTIPEKKRNDDFAMGELAISPDGQHIVVSNLNQVFFLTINGKVLKRLEYPEDIGLVQPTFSPDSQQVAFKYVAEAGNNLGRVTGIVFFTPQGKETTRFKVPQSQFMQEAIEKHKAAQEKKETEKEPPGYQKID